jgi:hypothetical protein
MTRNTSHGAHILWALLLFSPHYMLAQENLIEKLSEQEAENASEAENYLQELLAQPLEINNLTRESLRRLPFLTRKQIDAFLNFRQQHGEFKSRDEALAILAVSGDTLAFCQQIFFLSSPGRFDLQKFSIRWRVTRPATIEEKWLGPPYRSYERALLSTAAFSFGVLAERDPGEKRFNDHQLFFGQWQRESPASKWRVIAGNYQIEWAQGLALWSPYGTTISGDVHAASRREGRGMLPYLSGDENAALRGGAVALSWRKFSLLAFASSQQLDATLRDSATIGFYESGYHRISAELSHREILREQLFGAAMKINWINKIAIGVAGFHSAYDKNWIQPDRAAGYFDFTGRRNEVFSVSVAAATAALQTSVEVAKSRSGGFAGSAVLSGEASRLQWTAESHYFSRDFHNPRGRAFNTIAEAPQNEFGYALGLGSRLRRGMTAEIFLAKRDDLWRTSTLPLPGSQLMTGARLEWQMPHDLTLQMRWQQTRDDEILPNSRRSGRMKIEYRASPGLRLTSRLDFAMRSPASDATTKRGLAASQEAQWKWRNDLLITARYTLFDAPGSAPIYQYEHDVPGVFTNFALREQGRRAYIYLRYFSTFGFDLSLKLACTERERSLFEYARSCAWGAQIDWRLPPVRP